ncbi:phage portal protein [Acaricomes phytoseiuli]|uniref:phage portal protein n=1 Tax=Acaricomes phytoseiuli TaxID=291968 RepID=UPI0022230232|nr:phage portal protein [Acaricomes phytoseiuli]MCW1249654.1 phage portal protein [Acaricomes phytoseiuli]
MSIGSAITNAIRNRIRHTASWFMGREVDIFVNSSPGSGEDPLTMPVEEIWKNEPNLRTVIDFRARNIAHLGFHLFEEKDGERIRDRKSPVAKVMSRPNRFMTGYELFYDLVATLDLHGKAYWWIKPGDNGHEIFPFPASWVTETYSDPWTVAQYAVGPPGGQANIVVSAGQIVPFTGWSPSPGMDASPVEALRMVLAEQHHSRQHRLQLWKRGPRAGAYVSRSENAPPWSSADRARFNAMLTELQGDGSRAGGVPILEDGMEMRRLGFSSADEQWYESAKLSLEICARIYQINPTMVGVLDNANYSNVKEFSRAMYTNTLGPAIRQITDRVNAFVIPLIGGVEGQFGEFNIEEKLRGSFEEQAEVMTKAIGGPWMLVNEGRKLRNLPPIDSGDLLRTPLNVLIGGQSSPADGGEVPGKALEIAVRHADRIRRIIPSKGYDRPRFDRELADDLAKEGLGDMAEPLNEIIFSALAGEDSPETTAVGHALKEALDAHQKSHR